MFNEIILTLNDKIEEVQKTLLEKISQVRTLKGDQGEAGKDGKNGKDGRDGVDGRNGKDGRDGQDGRDGVDGTDGVGISEVVLELDNHLVVKLTDGREIDVGEIEGVSSNKAPNHYSISGASHVSQITGLDTYIQALVGAGGDTMYDKLIDTDGNYKYIGEATAGTTKSASSWRIKRVDLSSEDIEIVWADGTSEFTKVWDDRVSYNYIVEP
jgi:hypothetical protein